MSIYYGAHVLYFPHKPSARQAAEGMQPIDTAIATNGDEGLPAEVTDFDDDSSVNLRIVDANQAVHWRRSVFYTTDASKKPEDARYCMPV